MLYKCLNSESKKPLFIIVTGIGNHPKNNHLCEMKQAIVLFLGKHFSDLAYRNYSKNKGKILIEKNH